MAKRQTLEQWIKEARADIDKDGSCTAIALVHKIGVTDEDVHTTKLGSKTWSDRDLAEMFQRKAEAYAQDLPGVQTFSLLAFYGQSAEPQSRHPFIVTGALAHEEQGNATEEPSEKGQRQQGMRLLEQLAQGTFRERQSILHFFQSTITSVTDQNQRLLAENREYFEIMKEMLIDRARAESDRKLEVLKYERSSTERQKWLSYAPALINTILGREVFPQATADTALVETIIDSLANDDAAMQKLASVLPPELMAPIMTRTTEHLKAKRELTEEAKRLAQENEHADAEDAKRELQ